MEKIARSPDHFELALMKTLSKASAIKSYKNEATIGPRIRVFEAEENNVDDLHSAHTGKIPDQKTPNSETVSELDSVEDSFSCAGKALWEMENLRKIHVLDNINERVLKLMQVEEKLKSKMDDHVKLSKEEMDIKKLKSKINESSIHDEDLIVSQKILDLILRHADSKSKTENKTAENNAKADDSEEIKSKEERIRTLIQIQVDYRQVHKQIVESIVGCKNRETLIALATPDLRKIQELDTDHNNIIEKAKLGNVEDRDVETCSMVLKCVTLLADKLKKQIDQINVEEDRISAEEQKLAEIKAELENDVPVVLEEPEIPLAQLEEQNHSQLSKCVCQDSLDYYLELSDKLNDINERVNAFTNETPKDFIRKLKIAINTPVNSLSSISAIHMQDKFAKISQLLRGSFPFPVSNVDLKAKESCISFIIDFLSKRFINHAEKLLVPSKPEDAFRLASIIVALWIDFPDFGPILMAHIMKKCPYTIPAYWPQYKGQSDQDYYIARGYQYNNDGTLEDQSSFLNRMTGIFMLYVAVILTDPRKNQPHPYGLQNAWKWIAAIINLEPRPDVTAALIHTFLEMAGYKLTQFYGAQFWKIIFMLNQEYFFKIEKVTTTDFRGPVARLKEYLENVLRHGRFQEPKGVVRANYW